MLSDIILNVIVQNVVASMDVSSRNMDKIICDWKEESAYDDKSWVVFFLITENHSGLVLLTSSPFWHSW
jgi:hypothetical protein